MTNMPIARRYISMVSLSQQYMFQTLDTIIIRPPHYSVASTDFTMHQKNGQFTVFLRNDVKLTVFALFIVNFRSRCSASYH